MLQQQHFTSNYCRLCAKTCNGGHQRILYDETGQANETHELMSKYFTNAMLNMAWERHLKYICEQCWQHIDEFHQFHQSVIEAQKALDLNKELMNELKLTQDVNVKPEMHINQLEKQLELFFAQGSSAGTRDVIKPAAVTYVIKSEEPLDLNSDDGDGTKQHQDSSQLMDEEMSLMSLSYTRSEENSLIRDNDDDDEDEDQQSDEDYGSSDEMPLSSLSQANLSSAASKNPAAKKSAEEFDQLVALWRSSLECEICHELVPSFSHLQEHFSQSHISEICYVMCCQLRLENRYHIENHIRYHNAPPELRCETCFKGFRLTRYLRDHKRNIHSSKAEVGEKLEGKFRCDKCPKAFATKVNLNNHIRGVHVLKRLECNICDRTFVRVEGLRVHMAAHTGNMAHACSFCPEAFACRPYYRRHMRIYHPQEWKQMQNQTAQKESMKDYRRETRGGSMVYICKLCAMEYDKPRSMYNHLRRIHRGDRSSKFVEEEAALPVEQNLSKDSEDNQKTPDLFSLTENTSLYKCPVCYRPYDTKCSLNSHVRRMHQNSSAGINLQALVSSRDELLNVPTNIYLRSKYLVERTATGAFRCKVCSKEYEKKYSLHTHIKHVHPKRATFEQSSIVVSLPPEGDEEEDVENIQVDDHVIRMDAFNCSARILYQCNFCPKAYERKHSIFAHLQRTHNQTSRPESIITKVQVEGKSSEDAPRTLFRCNICAKEYENRLCIYSHVKRVHNRTAQIPGTKRPTYKKIVGRVYVPVVEVATNTGEEKVTPKPQRASMITEPPVPAEQQQNTLHKCPFCPRQYKMRDSLNNHKRRNHKNRIALNNQKSSQKMNLRLKYLSERSPNGSFRCKICSKEYEQKYWLYAHIHRLHPLRIKSEVATEEVEGQEKVYETTSVMYKCKFCPKSYENIGCMYAHTRRTHNKNSQPESYFIKYQVGSENPPSFMYRCRLCGKEYDKRCSIYAHVRRIHNRGTRMNQCTTFTRIVVPKNATKTTDKGNRTPTDDNDAVNVAEVEEDPLMMTVEEAKVLKIEEATSSTYVKTELKDDSNLLEYVTKENEMMEFEDATLESENFIKSEREFLELEPET
ncbi:zinc finger protein 845 isoform X2 [Stomoxys calcitrans]|uniref:zinc finger protein 845 isoform X2 n=1 Tax=Stomoxys calcitrans TaxID=35570 RepID=UPI0027E397B7|nr:zinc finger protein 845 isoform X2 [Stomoxys calcitrans]